MLSLGPSPLGTVKVRYMGGPGQHGAGGQARPPVALWPEQYVNMHCNRTWYLLLYYVLMRAEIRNSKQFSGSRVATALRDGKRRDRCHEQLSVCLSFEAMLMLYRRV